MNEKVLGFKEKDAVKHTDFTHGEILEYWVKKEDVVPVVEVEDFKKMKLDLLMKIHTLEAVISITKDEAVRLQALKGGKEK